MRVCRSKSREGGDYVALDVFLDSIDSRFLCEGHVCILVMPTHMAWLGKLHQTYPLCAGMASLPPENRWGLERIQTMITSWHSIGWLAALGQVPCNVNRLILSIFLIQGTHQIL